MDNLTGGNLFVDYFKRKYAGRMEDTMVVSPDVGSVARARNFAQKLGIPMAIVDKRRQKANSSEVMNIIGDVKDKHVILLDDLVDTAGSLCGASKALVNLGGAASVSACASHGVLSGPALERIDKSPIEEMVLLNTIPAPANVSKKISYISVAATFAEAISRCYNDTSINNIYR
jgi:ribose-phosphate pyrophosphokinase